MPKITAATLTVTALLIVGLTGCAGGTDDTTSAPETTQESTAPLVAETSEPATTSEQAYLDLIRPALEINPTDLPESVTDEQLLSAGQVACDQLATGATPEDVRVIENEKPGPSGYVGSILIATAAGQELCSTGQ